MSENSEVVAEPSAVLEGDLNQVQAKDFLNKRQLGLWMAQQRCPDSHAYNISTSYKITGNLPRESLESLLKQLLDSQPSFRTRFVEEKGQPKQEILSQWQGVIAHYPRNHRLGLEQQLEQLAAIPFNFEYELPTRGNIIDIDGDSCVVQLVLHHSVCDGSSSLIISSFLSELVAAHLNNEQPKLREPAVDEYLRAMHRHDVDNREALQFWQQELHGVELHIDISNQIFDSVALGTYQESGRAAINCVDFDIPQHISNQIRQHSKQHQSTAFCFMSTVFGTLLNRLFRVSDFAIGYMRDVRSKEDKHLVGFFVEQVPMVFRFTDAVTGIEMLQDIRHRLLNHRKIGNISTAAVMEHLSNGNAVAGKGLNFNIGQTIFESSSVANFEQIDGVTLEPFINSVGELDSELSFLMDVTGEAIRCRFNYNSKAFSKFAIENMKIAFEQVILELLNGAERPIASWELVGKEGAAALRQGYRYLAKVTHNYRVFPEVFKHRVFQQPHMVGVVDGEREYTYRDIHLTSNIIANRLIQAGVKPGSRVALCLKRGVNIVTAVLGIHKTGAAYVPICPSFPTQRKQVILADSDADTALVDAEFESMITAAAGLATGVFVIDELVSNPSPQLKRDVMVVENDATAVIFYTSGSTGKPKGVEVTHAALLNTVFNHQEHFPLGDDGCILFRTNYIFDPSFIEIYAWCVGNGRVAIMPSEQDADVAYLVNFINQNKVTHAQLIPSLITAIFEHLSNKPRTVMLPHLKYLLSGGEKFPKTTIEKIAQLQLNHFKLFNVYGPTEAAIYCTRFDVSDWTQQSLNVPIGRSIFNMRTYVLDEKLKLLPLGFAGELCIAGEGLAKGYRNLPEKTAASFVKNPFVDDEHARMYRTGDLVRYLADGNIEYLDRIDNQVKIRGQRIELGEIEDRMRQHDAISDAVAVVKQTPVGATLAAYYSGTAGELERQTLAEYLHLSLPKYMVPQRFQFMESIPTTPTGKFDRKALIAMPLIVNEQRQLEQDDMSVTTAAVESSTSASAAEVEAQLTDIWKRVLRLNAVGKQDNFFELGGHSLLITEVTQKIQQKLAIEVAAADFFRFPTIRDLTAYLVSQDDVELRLKTATAGKTQPRNDAIAVIGLACRYPGAPDAETFWQMLLAGGEGIREFTTDELLAAGVDPNTIQQPDYIPRKGIIEFAKHFDVSVFNYTPREADIIDPQQRLFLQEAYHALEDAGYADTRQTQNIGVYGGTGFSVYSKNLRDYALTNKGVTDYQIMMGNASDFLCTRVAYKLNLSGPAITVQTACSTSLVAIERACNDIQAGLCEMALVGGVSLVSGLDHAGYHYQDGMILSPDGHCRTFDARAKGTVPSQGVGLVVLKPLSKAQDDKDNIRAVIKGAAVNNDGNAKIGYTAPGINGQKNVIRMAQQRADVDPATIGYIEAHGTATTLGDPIEISALSLAFAESDKMIMPESCFIGSVKSNLGHTDTAAGIAGFIKTVLCLEHQMLVPSLHYETANPQIDFSSSPFKVNTESRVWYPTEDAPLRAGVSAFGIGGTNAHVILEQAPQRQAYEIGSDAIVCVPVSGATPTALQANLANLRQYLQTADISDLPNLGYTMQTGRCHYHHRGYALVDPTQEKLLPQTVEFSESIAATETAVCFNFVGIHTSEQLSYYLELQQHNPSYAVYVAELCADASTTLDIQFDEYLRSIHRGKPNSGDNNTLRNILGFVLELALARFISDIGIAATIVTGVGRGQITAACFVDTVNVYEVIEYWLSEDAGQENRVAFKNPKLPLLLASDSIFLKAGSPPGDWGLSNIDLQQTAGFEASDIAAKRNQTDVALHFFNFIDASEAEFSLGINPAYTGLQTQSAMVELFSKAWGFGFPVHWQSLHSHTQVQRISAPKYAFDQQVFYVEPQLPAQPAKQQAVVEANTSVLDTITDIWQDFLNMNTIGPNENFFDLGGESITALGLIDEVNTRYSLSLPTNTLYEVSTINELAELVAAKTAEKTAVRSGADASGYQPLALLQRGTVAQRKPLFLVHAAGGGLIQFSNLIRALGEEYTVYGFESPDVMTQTSIEELADVYATALLQERPDDSSYWLGGHSFGPAVVLAMSHKLQAMGKQLEKLILIDPPGPGKMPQPPENYTQILLHLNDNTAELDPAAMQALALEEQIAYFKDKVGVVKWRKQFTMITPAFVRRFKAQMGIMCDYAYPAIDLDAIYFTPESPMGLLDNDMYQAWQTITTGKLEIITVPGNHISMLDRGAVAIASKLTTVMP